jgi:hypothetical protein
MRRSQRIFLSYFLYSFLMTHSQEIQAKEQPLDETASVDKVKHHSKRVAIGAGGLDGLDQDSGAGYSFLIGWSGLMEPRVAINADAVFVLDGGGSTFDILGIGPQITIYHSETSVYVKTSGNYFYANSRDKEVNGFAGSAGIGLSFNRSADASLFIETNVLMGFQHINGTIPTAYNVLFGVAY